jgi:hypothetical protein
MCATKVSRVTMWSLSVALSAVLAPGCVAQQSDDHAMEGVAKSNDCIHFGNPIHTDGISKYEIYKPGHYCLTEDMHARFDMADHAAESTMIVIRTSDIVLDLQGHTLGRGRIFKNPGGIGIVIVDPYRYARGVGNAKDIVIRNGVLQDFKTGIEYGALRSPVDTSTFNPKTNTYHFPASNITFENITFKYNKKDFDIRLPDVPNK